MPRGDGTGPPGAGRGMGVGNGVGRGRMKGTRPGAGPAGECVCPSCGNTMPHQVGVLCYPVECPNCGKPMVRK